MLIRPAIAFLLLCSWACAQPPEGAIVLSLDFAKPVARVTTIAVDGTDPKNIVADIGIVGDGADGSPIYSPVVTGLAASRNFKGPTGGGRIGITATVRPLERASTATIRLVVLLPDGGALPLSLKTIRQRIRIAEQRHEDAVAARDSIPLLREQVLESRRQSDREAVAAKFGRDNRTPENFEAGYRSRAYMLQGIALSKRLSIAEKLAANVDSLATEIASLREIATRLNASKEKLDIYVVMRVKDGPLAMTVR